MADDGTMHKRQADIEYQLRACRACYDSEFGGGRAGTCPHCATYVMSNLSRHIMDYHLDLGQLWRCPGGGGGYSGYILVGVFPGTPKKGGSYVRAQPKKGGLRCGHSPKRGVLGAGTAPKKGGLRCGHNQKKGGLRHVYNPKKGEFRTDLVRSCSKGGLGSLFMYYLYFYLTI